MVVPFKTQKGHVFQKSIMSCQELKKVVIGSGENAQHSFVVLSNMVLKLFNLRFFIIIIIFIFLFFYSGINQKGLFLTVC